MKKIQYMKPRTTRVNIQNDYLLQATSGGLTTNNGLTHRMTDTNSGDDAGISYIRNGFQDFN